MNQAIAKLPLIYSDIPDLDCIRVGEDYYMVSTTMFLNPGVPVMHSKDLVHWEIVSYVYDTLEDDEITRLVSGKNCYGQGSWAASLRYHAEEQLYYVCFSSNDHQRTYIYTTDNVAKGPWKRHWMDGLCHDPALFIDEGKTYILYGNGRIHLQQVRLEDDRIIKCGEEELILDGVSEENKLQIEGDHAYKIGDTYYLFFINWPHEGIRTEWCYRSKSLKGPWEGKIICDSDLGLPGAGLAQGGIIDTVQGDWYGYLFQDHGGVGRVPVLLNLEWEDGWPIMKPQQEITVNLEAQGENYVYASDDFDYEENKLALCWQWNHNPDNSNWSVTERSGYLRLRTGQRATSIKDARNSLTQRTFGPQCVSEVCLSTQGLKKGDHAGICAFQHEYGQLGVMRDREGKLQLYYGNGTDSLEIVEQIEWQEEEICLQIRYDFETNIATFYYQDKDGEFKKIGNELSMSFQLEVFMGYRTYLFCYATEEIGGYADFDYYKCF